jgi:hypothetical protein
MSELSKLEVLIGEWRPEVPGADIPAKVTFEWLEGGGFVIQRSTVEATDFPNGVMVIGATGPGGGLQQHYFDSRGVHRIYEMTLGDGVWKLWRDAPNPFPQRFSGTFDDDGKTIAGRWEKAEDGSNWETDFELTYRKMS